MQSLVRDYNHFYSRSFNYQAGSPLPIDLEFLRPGLRLRRPVVDKMKLRIDFDVTVAALSTEARGYLSRLFSAVQFTDAHGERINFSDGSFLFLAEQLERGLTKINGPDLVAGANTGTFYLTLFDGSPRKSARKADYGIPLREMIDYGRLTINWSSLAAIGNISAINAGTSCVLEVWLREEVMDDNEVELKARHVWKDYVLSQQDFAYPVNGAAKWIVAFGGFDVGGTETFQATGFSSVISSELNYRSIPLDVLQEQYFEENLNNFAASPLDSLYDVVYQGFVQPLVWSKLEQKIALMPIIEGSCQFQFDTAPTTANAPRIIVNSIMDRNINAAAQVMGAPSPAAAASVIRSSSFVRSLLGTDSKGAGTINRSVVARLPMRIRLPRRK
jgi:hypothetical protein